MFGLKPRFFAMLTAWSSGLAAGAAVGHSFDGISWVLPSMMVAALARWLAEELEE